MFMVWYVGLNDLVSKCRLGNFPRFQPLLNDCT